ncbi:MAG: hypothetical protein WC665_09745 [Sulfurimonas sp.]|jgi:hypothetical protein
MNEKNIISVNIDYTKCYSIYEPILEYFNDTDLAGCHKRVGDKEIGKDGKDVNQYDTDIVNQVRDELLKASVSMKLKSVLSNEEIEYLLETQNANEYFYKLSPADLSQFENISISNIKSASNEVKIDILGNFTFTKLKIVPKSIHYIDEKYLYIWLATEKKVKLYKFNISFVYKYQKVEGFEQNNAYIYFVRENEDFYLDYAISFFIDKTSSEPMNLHIYNMRKYHFLQMQTRMKEKRNI